MAEVLAASVPAGELMEAPKADRSRPDWVGYLGYAAGRHHAMHVLDGLDFGVTPRMLRRRVRDEAWPQPHPNIIVTPGGGGFRTDAAALLRSLDARFAPAATVTALSHRSAAHLQGLWEPAPEPLDALRNRGASSPRRDGARVRISRTLVEDDVHLVDGLLCTRPARTIRDLAIDLTEDVLRATLLALVQRDDLALDEVVDYLPTLGAHPARRTLARVSDEVARTPVDSGFEYEVVEGARGRGLDPKIGFPWRCPDGRIIHLDLAFPRLWVALECDGKGAHGEAAFETDRIRWNQAGGLWDLTLLTWQMWREDRAAVLDALCRRVYTAMSAEARPAPAAMAPCSCRGCHRRGYAPARRATR